MTLDTGQIAIDRANARIAAEEEAAERWRSEHTCRECDYCTWDTFEGDVPGDAIDVGWCSREKLFVSGDDLDTTIAEWGCFD